jgi:hypothetical protein
MEHAPRTYYETREARDVALTLLERGYNPFPCGRPISKKKLPNLKPDTLKALKAPLLQGKGEMLARVYTATPTADTVSALPFPSFLAGVSARGLIVIDLDSKHAGFVEALEACQLALPHYATQSTMSHGRHFIARLPATVQASSGTVRWKGQTVGETRAGNAYICAYEPEHFTTLADLPEFDPDELPDGLTLTNTGMGAEVGKAAPEGAANPVDGALGTLETLMLGRAPHARHETLVAVLNVAHRLGVLDGAREILESDAVRAAWCADGSRDARTWKAEIERWAGGVEARAGKGYGLPYLKAQGFDVSALAALLATVKRSSAELPEIQVNGRYLRDISSDALKALQDANDPPRLFVRGEALVRVTNNTATLKAEPLTAVSLKGVLERTANFVKVEERAAKGEDGKALKDTDGKTVVEEAATPARVPNDLPPDLLTLQDLPFPKLEALAQTPVYAPSGGLVMTDGFDALTGFYLRLERLEGVRCDMRLDDARRLILEDCLGDFPFADPRAGRAHAVALILQPFVRNMIHGATPLYLIEAPTRGTGKGLLADVVSIISSGDASGVMFLPRESAELEKRITSLLLDGARVALLDNVTTLEGEALAAVLTSRMWKGRVLGRSQMVCVPNDATWIATGNNVTLDDDMPRRIIPIRLDPGVERPETRTGFRHSDLRAWVREHRAELVSACLSIVEAWRAAGQPQGVERLGTYEAWCEVMGGVLAVAGIPGLLEGREYLHSDSNQEPEEWAAVLKSLYLEHETLAFAARDVLSTARRLQVLLDYWAGRPDLGALKRLGQAMTKNRDRVFGGYRLRAAGTDGNRKTNQYRVTEADNREKTPQTPQNANAAVGDGANVAGLCFDNPARTPQNETTTPQRQVLELRGSGQPRTEPRNNPASLETVQHEAGGGLRGLRGFIPTDEADSKPPFLEGEL